MLKENETKSDKLWKAAGRSHSRNIFEQRKKEKSAYQLKIKENKKLETQSYTNELHEALLKKHGSTFLENMEL